MRHQNAAMRKATEKLAEASISAGVPHKVDGQTVNYLHDAMGSPTPAEIVAKGPKAMHQAMRDQVARYDDDRQERSERNTRDEYHENLRKNMQQLDCMNQLGVAPAPGDRVTGVIIGDEPPELRAQLWVDLLLAPSRKAVLGGQCAWLTQHFIGYDALKTGMNADALEGMCAFLGLSAMLFEQDGEHAMAVEAALVGRAEQTAPSLCQWLAHQPVEQSYMYGGNWKRPKQSSDRLLMSPLLTY